MTRSEGPGMIFTFILGAGVGAAAALLFAPKSGEDLRASIADGASDGVDQIRATGKQARQRAQKLVDMAKSQVEDAIEAGETAYNQARKA